MNWIIKATSVGCLVALSFVSLACDGAGGAPSATSSKETAQVKGKITLDGKPVGKVEVRFNPSNVNRKDVPIATTLTKDDGTYELTTLVGANQITLGGTSIAKKPTLSYYSQTVEIKSGPNDIDIKKP